MDIRAVVFDVNGTLVDIRTDDGLEEAFRAAGHFLTYQGIDLRRHPLRDLYFETLRAQKAQSPQQHPEFDAVAIWRTIIDDHETEFTKALPAEKRQQIPRFLAEMHRGITRRRLRRYPHVLEVLDVLRQHFPLAVVTDAQSAYARGELHRVGLLDYFDPIVVSGDWGYRKPDKRLFQFVLASMGVEAQHALYVGNDMFRDVFGARQAGMQTVLFNSDQGAKEHLDVRPDHTISDHRELLGILQLAH